MPPAWLFKSNVSATYRGIPMNPLWQIKQINSLEGLRHVDHNMAFGSHTAPKIWCTFFALVMWITIYICACADLMQYVDNAWSYEMDPILAFYRPYDTQYPNKQVKLLELYDELGLPHVKKKQIFGQSLELIRLLIDPIKMTITISNSSRDELTAVIRAFIDMTTSRQWAVIERQRILGLINWELNAYPLLSPALQPAYTKISGKLIT